MAERRMPTEEEYPSNAAIAPVNSNPVQLRGKVQMKSQSGIGFLKDDASHIGGYILYEILLPALVDLISDIGHSTIDLAIGRDHRGGYRDRYSSYDRRNDRYVSYNRMYDDRSRSRREREDERYFRRRGNDVDTIIFEYREDAEEILDRLCDYLERYNVVPLSYYYDICGRTVHGDFTNDDWGWTSFSSARVVRARKGYVIELPPVKPI